MVADLVLLDLEGNEDEVYDEDDDTSDYDVPLPDPLTLEVVQQMAVSLPLKAVGKISSTFEL